MVSLSSDRPLAPLSATRSLSPSIAASVAVHLIGLVLLIWQPQFRLPPPSPEIPAQIEIAIGTGASQTGAPPVGAQTAQVEPIPTRPSVPPSVNGVLSAPPPVPPQPKSVAASQQQGEPTARADVRLGDGIAAASAILLGRKPEASAQPDPFNVAPDYPAEAARRRETGEVVVAMQVNAAGDVVGIDLVQSSGSDTLDRVSIETLRKWHFQPALHDGKPVASVHRQVVEFKE